jgi:8-oxo-dGTP diphosphatase
MSIPNCFYRISIKALVLDEQGKLLLTREDNGWWELPGGGLDHGEDIRKGLAREIKEEMGLEVTFMAQTPSYFFTFVAEKSKQWMSNVVYEVKLKDLDFTPSDECQEIRFVTKEEAKALNLFPNIREFIENNFDLKNHL